MALAAPVVVEVSLAGPEHDHDTRVTFAGRRYRIVRLGTAGDVAAARELVREWAPRAAAIAVSGIREARALGLYGGRLASARRAILAEAGATAVTDGQHLAEVLQEWAVRRLDAELPGHLTNARVVVLGGRNHARTARVLREHTANIEFADPLLRLDLPGRLGGIPLVGAASDAVGTLAAATRRMVPDAVRGPVELPAWVAARALARRSARDCDVVVAAYEELTGFGLEDLAGKTLVTSAVSDERLAELGGRGVDLVVDIAPQPFDVVVDAALLEALMIASVGHGGTLTDDDLLDLIVDAGLEPRLLQPNGPRRKSRFAFVIHPLSQQYFRNVEPLRTVTRLAPQQVMTVVEKAVAYSPPFTYSHVTGIVSPTGAEAEGWLITVGGTPKEMLAHDPEFTYRRLLTAAETARRLGAQIMGLGAFTKVVGDAGVTVARRAPLPVTTGNSYSASAALWAAHEALRQLGLAEVDAGGTIRGTAMVVGATGAIGSVCARLLAVAEARLWLVSPETAKLLTLKAQIEEEHPGTEVHIATTPDAALPDMDLVVTATSGAGKKVLDIMAVKPGAVITDVARPLDLSAEDVAKRPDVLVIESGEIQLPGDVHMRDIGLPPGVAYACLAETVVLALEGRYETFTVGRHIEWKKVKEIYRLGLKHGMRLATMSGVNGVVSADDIARIRRLALASGSYPERAASAR
ncbi:serine carboxypeptidase [Nocardioides flavus (ex Wang et al. 2016)]|uniref:Serine carboxypeptidase n=1 Tax=Nocardioides flavus (ex Wang et al. 2016) TaxID=2058780 RepID=A0ABQ3HJZ8_9ACTN|nr:dehydrogenase [Nocardioides flavus (ex Wang et al. 2016)]GHE16200.1 serine carboxypeptidase [Nocardioides flavus (ex Wang et al. 2016)]